MKLPWQRRTRKERLVIALTDEHFAYAESDGERLLRCGLEARTGGDAAALARRVHRLGLADRDVTAVLSLADCQLLQIEAPAVPPEELKAAARWKIKELVEAHIDDLTLDVMQVGDGRKRGQRQLFVAAARNQAVRELAELSQAARLGLAVIDIRETAQRNLQTALAVRRGGPARADAALMVHGAQCLLTICAQGELFYTRRLEWQPAGLQQVEPSLATAGAARRLSNFADLDIVDYGAADHAEAAVLDDAPAIVLELQRSLDLWDRSWPDLPLDRLMVHGDGHTHALVALLAPALPVAVEAMNVEAVFPGFAAAAGSPQVASAVLPLLGALLRQETRQL